MNINQFSLRHIGLSEADKSQMLQTIKASNLKELTHQTIPQDILVDKLIDLPPAQSEFEHIKHMKNLGTKNTLNRSYIGWGYYNTILPPVIQRNILENPGWYTAYTPYQAEIAQGRLEALLNFQTMISDLTGFELANASLLDEGTAAAEAMHLLFEARNRAQKKENVIKFFISDLVFPQTIEVLKTKADGMGIELVIGSHEVEKLDESFFGVLLQYPAKTGENKDYTSFVADCKTKEIKVAVAADILSLTLLKPPAEWGADVAVGSTQRFGIPMGYGGPHAAYFATHEEHKRLIPGRIIGVSQDMDGSPALRMALQTREQHIKRERATSNICTAQVLLAVMAGMYAVYHGPKGLKFIADNIHQRAVYLQNQLKEWGYETLNTTFFDTIRVSTYNIDIEHLRILAEKYHCNLNYFQEEAVSVSLDDLDVATEEGINSLLKIFAEYAQKEFQPYQEKNNPSFIGDAMQRTSNYLAHPVFNSYHTETELMRYIKRLEKKDLALNQSMIPLGSCTMKLNAAAQLLPLSWSEFGSVHPYAPKNQTQGYLEMIMALENYLSEITGFYATSLQPNSGAQGEYAGLMVIRAYHHFNEQAHRKVVLIPESAHGTNPASAVLAGMKVVIIKNHESGEISEDDLDAKIAEHGENLAALMITYPSTYGVFDANVKTITEKIHAAGGQVYMDGANMNAQVGLTHPAAIGADVCHLNLHKTFAIPHGGGGPGVGPICVAQHLAAFLPSNFTEETSGRLAAISAAPYGSSLIHAISYGYIRLLGAEGLKASTEAAILSANYIKNKLAAHFDVLYENNHGRVAHELIIDCRPFKKVGVEVTDIAKRLMDYGFHAPTVSFPVAGTLMIEPTESESKGELDRFIQAMIQIKKEIDEIAMGAADAEVNVLKNAPHTLQMLTADEWMLPYSREKAAYPLDWVADRKFWPSVRRVNDAFGDRNLMCTCAPVEMYNE